MLLTKLQASHRPLICDSINDKCFLTIVVPVRNESEHIAKTLKSLTEQVDSQNRPLDQNLFEIIFFVNNSDDDSAEIIRRCRKNFSNIHLAEENLPPENSNIGYVRRRLMNEAFLRLCGNRLKGGIISTTDGDTTVAPNWLASITAEIKSGADAVGGRIFIHPEDLRQMNSGCRAFHLRDTGYRLMAAELESYLDESAYDSLPRHHQHFNGSFAVTTEAFEKAGGVPEVSFLEDVAFYHALLRIDARFRHSPFVRVQTSARNEGRTGRGLSTQINEWTIMSCNNDEYLVESANSIKNRFETRRRLRFLWSLRCAESYFSPDETERLANELRIDAKFLRNQIETTQTFGRLYENVLSEQNLIGEWSKENPLAEIEKANYDLRLLLEKYRRGKKFI